MKIKLSATYKNILIEIEDQVDSGAARAKTVAQLKYVMDNIDEKIDNFQPVDSLGEQAPTDNIEDATYLEITPNQITYLKKLGATEKQIAKLKNKNEASALITKLQQKQ